MFNRELYEEVEHNSGFRKKFIAERMGIGYTRYIAITTGMAPWKLDEIDGAVSVLKMKKAVRDRIFFNSERPNMATIKEN